MGWNRTLLWGEWRSYGVRNTVPRGCSKRAPALRFLLCCTRDGLRYNFDTASVVAGSIITRALVVFKIVEPCHGTD
jgi:hypothetical protein